MIGPFALSTVGLAIRPAHGHVEISAYPQNPGVVILAHVLVREFTSVSCVKHDAHKSVQI